MAQTTGFPKTSDIAQTIGVLKTSVKATKKRSPDSDSDKSQGSKGSARLFRYNQRCSKEILTLVPATKVNNGTPAISSVTSSSRWHEEVSVLMKW